MFNIRQANFKSAHLLNKMALIQFQSNRTVYFFDINYIWQKIFYEFIISIDFNSAHLVDKMALIQFQSNRTVHVLKESFRAIS